MMLSTRQRLTISVAEFLFHRANQAMHELAIGEAIVSGVCDQLGSELRGAKVTRVVLEIGRLSGVSVEPLRFSFDLCVRDTPLAGAALEIVDVPGRGRCRGCGQYVDMGESFQVVCGHCGGVGIDILNGQELRIRCVEVL